MKRASVDVSDDSQIASVFERAKAVFDKQPSHVEEYSHQLYGLLLRAHQQLKASQSIPVRRDRLMGLIKDMLAEWNRVPVPGESVMDLRWRAKWNLLYFNNDAQINEMLSAARVVQHRNPRDVSANKTLGWLLHDAALLKANSGHQTEAERLVLEFDSVLARDLLPEALRNARKFLDGKILRYKIKPVAEVILEGKPGESIEATGQLLAIANRTPHLERAVVAEILDGLRELRSPQRDKSVRRFAFLRNTLLLEIYPQLKSSKVASFEHSLVLRYAIKLFERDALHFLHFLDLWNLDLIRPEDYEGGMGREGRRYRSVVSLLMPAMAGAARETKRRLGLERHLKAGDPQTEKLLSSVELVTPRVCDFSLAVHERFPDHSFYAYHCARILAATGAQARARQILSQQASALGEKWWYWKALAETCASAEDEIRLRFLCKACVLRTKRDEDFMRGVFGDISKMFKAREVEVSPANVRSFAEEAWGFVSSHKVEADAVLLKVSRTLRAFSIHALAAINGGLEEVGGTVESSFLEKSVRGDAVALGLLRTPSAWRVVSASPRSGDKWDVLPWHSCIVVSSGAGRSVWNVYSETGAEFRVPVASWKRAAEWAIGKPLMLKFVIQKERYFIVAEEEAGEPPDFVQVVTHKVEKVLPGGGARLPQGICVPRRIAAPMGITEGDTVKVTLVPATSPERRVRVIAATRI